MVDKIPEGMHTLTPHLVVSDANAAIEFYKRAFGAVEGGRMTGPDGKRLIHASVKIGDSVLMLVDDFPEFCGGKSQTPQSLGGSPVTVHMYVEDVDSVFKKAVEAGATEVMPVADQFWGDRYGKLTDPFGHEWSIATHVKDVNPADMQAACMT